MSRNQQGWFHENKTYWSKPLDSPQQRNLRYLILSTRISEFDRFGVCGVWVGCCLAPVRVPWFVACCARSPGLWHPAAVAAWHLALCLGCGRRRASLACLAAPRGAPRLVRSGRSRCSSLLSRRLGAFPQPNGLVPPALLDGCAGHAEAGREPGSLCLPLATAEAGALGSLRVVRVRGPAIRLSLAGPSDVGLGLRALRWLACVDPLDRVCTPYKQHTKKCRYICIHSHFTYTGTVYLQSGSFCLKLRPVMRTCHVMPDSGLHQPHLVMLGQSS